MNTSHAPALHLESVTRRYGNKVALDAVSVDVEPGSFTVLLGPSGSGKSTLLRCVAGIDRVSTGTIRFDETVMANGRLHMPAERRGLAMVFQEYALWPHLTTLQNVQFALRRLDLPKREARTRATAMLDRVGLGGLSDRYPSDLSGGEQQRVALARALVAGPGLLLFDEPLSNLDADLRERLRVEIATLTRDTGATALYITHDQSEAFALADRIGVLDHGALVQFCTAEELYANPATPFVAHFTGLAGELPVVVHDPGTSGYPDVRIGGQVLAGCSVAGLSLRPGDRARLLVRSAAVTFDGMESDRPYVSGVICDVAFRGRGYDHVVEIDGRHRLAGVFHSTRHDRGSSVRLRLDPSGCLVFPSAARCPSDRIQVDGTANPDLALIAGGLAGPTENVFDASPDGDLRVGAEDLSIHAAR